jgi:NTP pyrophosphatase (non-canonical NTP hydrolase)
MKTIDQLSKEVHEAAIANGWWETRDDIVSRCDTWPTLHKAAKANIEIAALGLAMSECGEAMDAIRKGYPADDKLPQYGNHAVEIADAIIRLLDLTAKMNIPIGNIIEAKLEVNRKRGHMHGGKSA